MARSSSWAGVSGARRLYEEGPPPPGWYVFQAKPGAMHKGREWLEVNGVDVWWPVKHVWRRNPRKRNERLKAIVPVAPGYVFTRWPGPPRWFRIFDIRPGCDLFSHVVSSDGRPRLLKAKEFDQMAQIPDRLAKEREEARLKPGDRAQITEGIYSGWIVDVGAIEGELAEILIPILGGKFPKIRTKALEKLDKENRQ